MKVELSRKTNKWAGLQKWTSEPVLTMRCTGCDWTLETEGSKFAVAVTHCRKCRNRVIVEATTVYAYEFRDENLQPWWQA